jgi:hypothetical protein
MAGRREIQQQHERAIVAGFLEWFTHRRNVSFRVIEEPNPPEAIIQSPRLTRWVEVVDAFWTREWARDQYSYATPGERHIPIGAGPHPGPDANFAYNFVEAVSKKLAKTSYLPALKKYGAGYLVVNVDYPHYDRRAHRTVEALWAKGRPWPNQGCFREVFLRIRMFRGYRFQGWKV